MATNEKTVTIRFRGTRLESKRLAALSKLWELTPSATLRRILAESYTRHIDTPKREVTE